jgi:predicted ArsR family transcriptional regulator
MAHLDALGNPTKLRVVRRLETGGDASLQQLAQAAGVHLNTARQHVAELERDGIIERVAATPAGRGRPALRYRLVPGWTVPTSDFRGLAQVLATALTHRGATADEVREVGVEWGRHCGCEVSSALEQLGFSAKVHGDTLELTDCPCPCMLPDQPELICELALAVTDGVLAGSGSPLRVAHTSHDPERRSCSAHLHTEVPA